MYPMPQTKHTRWRNAPTWAFVIMTQVKGVGISDSTPLLTHCHPWSRMTIFCVILFCLGKCACYDGFDGPACNHMSCPNNCNGHGRCLSLHAAAKDFDGYYLNHTTTYDLWDSHMIRGCVCDPGFSGYDCSLRECNMGPDVRGSLGQHETVTLVCQCGPTCAGNFR